jgi:hypothetical protein
MAVKIQMDTDSFRIYLEQRAVIPFFMLKELKPGAIHTEFK